MKEKTKGWVFFAERDRLMAETAMSDSRLTGQVAFHSQQTIENFSILLAWKRKCQNRKLP